MNTSQKPMSMSESIMPKDPSTLSERVDRIQPSPTLAVSARAEELIRSGKNIINLSVGEPDFDTPLFIKEAAICAIQEGHTKYTAVDGIKSLKQAVVDKFQRDNQLNYELNQIIVSCGAKHSLYNLFTAILNPGDEVIIPAPYWVSYPDIVALLDGKPVIVSTDATTQFKLTPDSLKPFLNKNTRAIILNSPCNPSGMAYTKEEWQALAALLLEYPNILIVTDDIYEHTLWNHLPFTNILNVCPDLYSRTVVVNGVAKTYAMTGWRIGYAAGDKNIIAAMKKAQSQSTSNPCSISQYAALAALSGDQSCVTEMTNAYKIRHDFLFKALNNIPGFECLPSDGTFYSFPSIKPLLSEGSRFKNDLEFAEFLLNKAEIAVIPGSAFGTPGHLRLSYAAKLEKLEEAIKRLTEAIHNL